jgi:hypothetical protein
MGYQDHRPERISDDEEGQAEEGGDVADVELLHYAEEAGGVDGRADVDGYGEEADLEGDEDFFGAGPVFGVLFENDSLESRALMVSDEEWEGEMLGSLRTCLWVILNPVDEFKVLARLGVGPLHLLVGRYIFSCGDGCFCAAEG